MPQCCAVPFCSAKTGGHKFPRDKTVCEQWIVAIRRDNYIPSKHARVCKKHFKPDDFELPKESYTENPIPKLKPKVVPSRFCWNQESDERKEIKRKHEKTQQSRKKRVTATLCSNTVENQCGEHFVSEQEVQPGPSKALGTPTSLDSNTSKEQDPLSRVIERCRFCGEFSKDCISVSSNMPYLAHNKTTLVLNDTSVQLDFNDGSLPNTVCRDCDAKLQEIADFVKVVKAAQDTLINVAEERAEFAETRIEIEVARAEETEVDTGTETIVIKTEYVSQHEESDDDKEDKEGNVDSQTVSGTVFNKKSITHKRKSNTATYKPKRLKTVKECEIKKLIIDIKEEVIEKDDQEQSNVSDYLKPSESKLATSDSVFKMSGYGTSEYQGYRSNR